MKELTITFQAEEGYMIQDVLLDISHSDYITDGSVKAKVIYMGDGKNEEQKVEKKG